MLKFSFSSFGSLSCPPPPFIRDLGSCGVLPLLLATAFCDIDGTIIKKTIDEI